MTRPNFTTNIAGSYRYTNSVGADSTTNVADNKSCSEVITGVSRRKPSGWVPPTGYSLLRREYHRANGTASKRTSGVTETYTGSVGYGRFNSHNHFEEILDENTARLKLSTSAALAKARNKLRASDVNLGVAFAERKATSRMLGDTAIQLAETVLQLRHGNFRNAARVLGIKGDPGRPRGQKWPNHWLQLQYGWKPLLSDLHGACNALSKRAKEDWNVTAKASSRDTENWKFSRPPQGSAGGLTGSYDSFDGAASRQRGVFVRIDAYPENDLKMSLSYLGVTNPLLVGWELVPYSFVVDWFIPVGNWLDSLDALLGYGPAWTSITTYNECTWVDTGLSKDFSPSVWVHNDWVGTKRLVEVVRTATSGVPLPAFPRFKDPRSLVHAANGLSLLAGAMGRSLHPGWGVRG